MTGRLLLKVLPPPGLPRAIAFQSAVIAIGGGTYITGSVVFFTHVLHLSPLQIGTGLSISGLASLAMSLPLGGLADRLGGQRSWVIGALVEAAGFASYPLAKSFAAFVVAMVVTSLADTFGNAGRTIYTADALPPEGRVRAAAFARSYLNVGFTVGAGLGAAALAFNSTAALIGIVLLNAAILLVNAAMVARLPAAPIVHHEGVKRSRLAVLKDTPFLAISAVFALLWVHGIIFNEIIPLWAITHTDAPKPMLGGLFALNTVMAVTLQVRATRGADSLTGSVRMLRRAAVATAIACPVIALSGRTHGWVTIVVIASAVVLTTCTELWSSAVQWYFQNDVVPAAHRGAYVGTSRMITGIGNMVAPAGLTLLAIQTGGWGWWVVAAIFAGCWFIARPAVGWVARTPRIDGQIPAQRTPLQPATEPA
jgi:MFS family permease